ncbi:MAG: glycosyltransferase [Oscillospiraceae bacterium]|nr:glycosyltransferase [Oscillospiraceae bacterium]
MIFKDDIRSIERCLKALQPLREAVPCELVMADTGSTDGSRAVAERYADILFDFPWINDFAAARNAVLDRCTGVWCLILDTDEYLDENINELVTFLCRTDEQENPLAIVTVRNYDTYDMEGEYSDFLSPRIVRMSTGVRYQGAIHEHFDFNGEVVACSLPHTILHHDGYVAMHEKNEEGKAKTERNSKLLRQEMADDPDNLILRLQFIEAIAADNDPDYVNQLRQAVQLIREKKSAWEKVGPPILRYAVYAAEQRNLPEWDEWLNMAEEWFPDSMFTRLDVEYTAFVHSWNTKKDFQEALRWGNRYLKALEDYRSGADPMAQMYSTFQMTRPTAECLAKVHMISAYCSQNQLKDAFDLAKTVNYAKLNGEQMGRLVASLQDIHYRSSLDTAPIITQIWSLISDPKQPEKKTSVWKTALAGPAGRAFLRANIDGERTKKDFVRHAYTMYLPIKDTCEIGRAAAVMELSDAGELEATLAEVKEWGAFSIHALAHAMAQGARFPLPGKTLYIEEMDKLATRLAGDPDFLFPMALRTAENSDPADWQGLCWLRGLLMAAIRAFPWGDKEVNEEQGMALARAFAKAEGAFLPACYRADILCGERLFTLPPLHRFGFVCVQAFDALDRGAVAEYVRLLRTGLEHSPEMKGMVEFLADHTQEIQEALVPPELQTLADQVRTVLARFAPDDPALQALRESEAYRKVAHLIEGMPVPVTGRLLQ